MGNDLGVKRLKLNAKVKRGRGGEDEAAAFLDAVKSNWAEIQAQLVKTYSEEEQK